MNVSPIPADPAGALQNSSSLTLAATVLLHARGQPVAAQDLQGDHRLGAAELQGRRSADRADDAGPAAAGLHGDPDRHHQQQERRAARGRPAARWPAARPCVAQFQRSHPTAAARCATGWPTCCCSKLDIVPSRESSVVEICFKGADPHLRRGRGQRLCRRIPERLTVQLKTEPMKKASTYFDRADQAAARQRSKRRRRACPNTSRKRASSASTTTGSTSSCRA